MAVSPFMSCLPVVISPKGLEPLSHAGENRVGQRIKKTENAEGGYADVTHQMCQHQIVAKRCDRGIQLGNRLWNTSFADLTDHAGRNRNKLEAKGPFFADKVA